MPGYLNKGGMLNIMIKLGVCFETRRRKRRGFDYLAKVMGGGGSLMMYSRLKLKIRSLLDSVAQTPDLTITRWMSKNENQLTTHYL